MVVSWFYIEEFLGKQTNMFQATIRKKKKSVFRRTRSEASWGNFSLNFFENSLYLGVYFPANKRCLDLDYYSCFDIKIYIGEFIKNYYNVVIIFLHVKF